jgi:hypothetical protein
LISEIAALLVLSCGVGSGSWLLTHAEISKPIRLFVAERSAGKFWNWLSRLLQCPYCTGMWLSIFAVAIYRPRLVHEWLPLDYLVSVMALSGISMLTVLIIRKALGK